MVDNIDLVKKLFNNIANSHNINFQCNRFPDNFYYIVNEKANSLGYGEDIYNFGPGKN